MSLRRPQVASRNLGRFDVSTTELDPISLALCLSLYTYHPLRSCDMANSPEERAHWRDVLRAFDGYMQYHVGLSPLQVLAQSLSLGWSWLIRLRQR